MGKKKEPEGKTTPISIALRLEERQILERFSAENEGNISATVRRIIREYAKSQSQSEDQAQKSTAA